LPGERNPHSAAEEFAPPPQGESVLDASMMAELNVTKNGDLASAQKVHRNLAGQAEKPRRGWSKIAVRGTTSGRAFDSMVCGFGGAFSGGVRRLSLDASWRQVRGVHSGMEGYIQCHSQDRRHQNSPVGQETRSSGASFAAGRKAIANLKSPRRRKPTRACPANTRWAGE